MTRFTDKLGIDSRLLVVFPMMVLATAATYSAWTAFSNQPLAETAARFIPGLGAMLGFALLLSPILLPFALVGWGLVWALAGLVRLNRPARAALAGAAAGFSAATPIALAFSGPGNDSAWAILVQPLLWIAPVCGAISAWEVCRKP